MAITDPITQSLKRELVDALRTLFVNDPNNKLFFGVSRILPWDNTTNIPTAIDSVQEQTNFWRQCFALKRIRQADVSYVIPRINWSAGQVFDPYRDDVDLFSETDDQYRFYVLVDGQFVYKCIDNNDGAVSQNKPTSTATNSFRTTDGYQWKYMYKITPQTEKFLTTTFMPVGVIAATLQSNDPNQSQLDVQRAAVDGSIDFINVTTIGDVFTNALIDNSSQVQAFTTGAKYTINADQISRSDSAYLNYTLKILQGQNAGQIRRITAYNGATRQATVQSPFSNESDIIGKRFSVLPSVVITGDGTGALAQAQIDTTNSLLSRVNLVSRGSGYTYASVSILPEPTQFGLTNGVKSQAQAILSPPGGTGSNAIKELGAASIMAVITLDSDEENTLQTNADFGQIGLVLNPTIGGTVAGTEQALLRTYTVTSSSPISDFSDYLSDSVYIMGSSSGFRGLFRSFNNATGNPNAGSLVLKNPNGKFFSQEPVVIYDTAFAGITTTTVKIAQQTLQEIQSRKNIYRATTKLILGKITDNLTTNTFSQDTQIKTSVSGTTALVSSWENVGTTSGTLEVVDLLGTFQTGQTISLFDGSSAGSPRAIITGISAAQIDYRSGDVIYIQNIENLQRQTDQREEIKIVISL